MKIKIISVILALAIIVGCIPFAIAGSETEILELGLISDIHYYPDKLKGNFCKAYEEFSTLKGKEYTQVNSLLSNALDGVEAILKNAEETHSKYVLLPGDLTKDGEYEGHKELAAKLEAWENKTGISVFVINGNHDINNSNSVTFENGKKESSRKTSPEEFKEIYKNLGWDKALEIFTPTGYSEDANGIKGGMLSYTANLGDGFRLIAVDTGIYSVDNGAKTTEHLTDGQVSDELLDWVVNQAKKAKNDGKTPIVMQHHNLVPHMDIEEATFWSFVCYDWERIADTYADAGIHYVFTGHLHASDTASYVSDNGEKITDILTPTLTGYPNYFKGITLTTDRENVSLDMVNYDIDDERLSLPEITDDFGKTFERPYKYSASFPQTFGLNIEDFIENLLKHLINEYFEDILSAGGIVPFLKTKGVDVQALLTDLLGTDGLSIGSASILTVSKNAMSFINGIDKQIVDEYIKKPEETLAKVMKLINKLLSLEVSKYPCTYNSEVLDVEYKGTPCTLGEYATTALLVYYGGDENLYGKTGYEYVEDAIKRFDSGENAKALFDVLLDVVLHDLVEDEILSVIDFNPGDLFPDDSAFHIFGKLLQKITEALLNGNNSIINLVNSVLNLDIVPDGYNSIDEILDTLVIDRFLTQSQFESWGGTIAWMVKSMVFDVNPSECNDNNVTLTYNGKVEVEATKENFRLPNNIVLGLTDKSNSMTVTYITKYSITDTDIELIPYSENPQFTGKATKNKNIETKQEISVRSYPGADLGIFGLFNLEKDYIKHTVTLSNLTPGEKYCYRVGSAERNWWSDVGTITVSKENDEAFTFFNVTDPQAQRPEHYKTYKKVIDNALSLYPEARLVVSNGDQVDLGTTSKYWNYFFNSSSAFLSLPFMPTTGNHEKSGNVLKTNFTLPNVPEQDENTGTYYSFDYNNVHFTVLNTNDLVNNKLSEEQLDWMIDDIKSSTAKWKVVTLHKALYCNGTYYKDDETVGLRNQLAALLPYLGVDLVLSGHNHVYSRTGVMNGGALVPTKTKTITYNGEKYKAKINPKGTIYSIIGQAGIKEYKTVSQSVVSKYFPAAEKYLEETKTMFAAITVDGNNLYYNAYSIGENGESIKEDSFAIEKTGENTSLSSRLSDNISNLIAKILSMLNIQITWKFKNLVYTIFGKIFSFLFV